MRAERFLHARYAIVLFFALLIGGEFLLFVLRSPYSGKVGEFSAEKIIQIGHSQTIGMAIFNDYLLPFEIIGIFLFLVMRGPERGARLGIG